MVGNGADGLGVGGLGAVCYAPAGGVFVAGLAAGLLVATRVAAAVALPVLALFIAVNAIKMFPPRTEQAAGQKIPVRMALLWACSALLVWGIGLLPGFALVAWYNEARFGTALASGYASESGLFTTPLAVGLYGLLFSPGKSIVLYAPAILVALPGSVGLWRAGKRGVVLLCWALFLSHLLLYAQWGEWQGGGVWGPRFLLPVVPLLVVLGAGLGIRQGLAQEPGTKNQPSARTTQPQVRTMLRPQWAFIGTLAALGFVGNLSAVLLNVNTYLNTPTAGDKIYDLAASPLIAQWQLLGDRWGALCHGGTIVSARRRLLRERGCGGRDATPPQR
ncbi:hypothetical protein HC891_28190 [Candidatus Gracilibacteria bacterium]|nr:hypothetical protein [Candidatus Gracilibacteria bacterium]